MTIRSLSPTNQKSDSSDRNFYQDDRAQITYQWVFDLNSVNIGEYNELTFPSIKKRSQIYKQRGKWIGVTAFSDKTMVGLVVSECLAGTTNAEIISLFVQPNYRHQGIGTNLVKYLEQGLVKAGYSQIQVNYKTTQITKTDLEPLLQHCGWQQPETKMVLGMGTTEAIAQAPWLHQYQLSSDFEIFPWKELTESDREQIQNRKAQKPWYPEILSPFHLDPRIEPLNSLGLRYQGKVVGWTINHRVAPDTIRYSILFIAEEFQRSGKGIVLLTESIRLQIDSPVPYGKFAVQIQNQPMLRLVRRHLSPYLIGQTESRSTQKNLISANSH